VFWAGPRPCYTLSRMSARAERTAVALLLLALCAQLAYGLRADGLTNDEVLYIAAGWRQLALGDYRLNTTHPPLAPDIAALGLLGLRPRTPDLTAGDDVLAYSWRFLHVENAAGALLARARAPVVLLTLLLALLGWAWAREVGGPPAGLLALALLAFHPTLLAHGHLATTDLPSTAGMLGASYAFFRWTRRPRPLAAAATALALGLAGAARLTALVLLPCFLLLALVRVRRGPRPERGRALRETALLALAVALLLPLTLWAAYGFHDPPVVDPVRARPGPLAARALDAAERLHLAPAAYVESVRFQIDHNRRGHLAYLLGQRSRRGWPTYFLVALAVKSTPGWLAALLLAAGWSAWGLGGEAAKRREAPRAARRAPPGAHSQTIGAGEDDACWHWLLPALVSFAAVSAGHIQIGERYLLPVHVYLVLWVAVSLAAWMRTAGRPASLAVAALLSAHALPALAVLPRGHLAYFNLLAGGEDGGHRVLLDSNLDWGQDLPRLARWMRARGVASVRLAYMGADDPARFGIAYEALPGLALGPHPAPPAPLAGTVVVSPNLLFGLAPSLDETYAPLRGRAPDARAGVFFVYVLPAAPPRP